VNVNTASREELLGVGGLRPEIVDEIVKLRRTERITGPEALEQVPGVGPATLEQLRKALDFSDRAKDGGNGDDRGQERERSSRGGEEPAPHMREAVRAATRAGAEAAETVGRDGLQVVQRAASTVAKVERAVAHRSAEGTAELGRTLLDLVEQQTRRNLEAWTALTEVVDWGRVAEAVNWDRVFQIQGEFWRASLEQAAQLTQRYLEASQTVMTAAADATREQGQEAA
jgi:hypothetical protein